jgi:hypothetical protein
VTRVRCLNKSCSLNERGTCSALEIDLDYDGQCETADETLEEDLEEPLADDEAADEWEEDEDNGWDDDEI